MYNFLRKSIAAIAFVLTTCFIITTDLQSQTIITDRPDQTESPVTIAPGALQIESGLLLGYAGESTESIRQLVAPTTLFRVGLTSHLELRVVHQFESLKSTVLDKGVNGMSDLEVGAKIKLFQKEGTNVDVAFLSHLIIPTGSSGLTADQYGTVNKLAIAHQLGSKTGLGYNIGYNNFGEGDGDLTYAVSIGYGITDKVSLFIEPYGDLVEFENHISSFDAGITYLLTNNFQLDFSFGTGINHKMNFLSFGFSWLVGAQN